MRKAKSRYSAKALKVLELGEKQGHTGYWGNPTWALIESGGMETPCGDVHLHWSSHRGQGSWKIIQNPQWRGEICGTVRCRRVHIEPYGGANEVTPINVREEVLDKVEWDIRVRYGEYDAAEGEYERYTMGSAR